MEGCIERDHRLAAGGETCDLDGVLDSLGARVEEGGARRAGERRELPEPLGKLDVPAYGTTVKSVWMKRAACSWIASTTCGWL